ncbi:CHAT domain-containing protein [Desulfococcaceae bacterium HSG7]|nr:CHAT domain-containing protein [Desulfococcaceae bacterium HSG7]
MISKNEVLFCGQASLIWGMGGVRDADDAIKDNLIRFVNKINAPDSIKKGLTKSGKLSTDEEMSPILATQFFLKEKDSNLAKWWQLGWFSILICNMAATNATLEQIDEQLINLNNLIINLVGIKEAELISEFVHKLHICDDEKEKISILSKIINHLRSFVADADGNKINKISVLFLSADPTNASRLRLDEEFREIDEQLRLSELRDSFKLELPKLSVRPKDISGALLNTKPDIVHFSGHGTSNGALCLENETGQIHTVQPDTMAALFEQFANQVNCILLNACYSKTQAEAISEHINYVIGMNKAIGDEAAIAFAIGFYQALGAGRTIEEAYNLGCVQIRLLGIPEHLTLMLIKKGQLQS